MTTIPANLFARVLPSVLTVAGDAIDMIALMLTTSTRVPLGTVQSFPDAASVSDYFGASSGELTQAAVYFAGFTNADAIPGSLLFAQYNDGDVGAYLRGGKVSGLTLAELQAFSGTLSIVINGVTKTGSPNLSAATSFSNAATIIADTLDLEGTGGAVFTAAIAGTTMTVSAVSSGTLAIGQLVDGAGTTAGTYITALGSGTGGTGTYTVSASQSVSSEAMTSVNPGVSYDSVSGAFVVISSTTGAASTIAFATGTIADDLKLQAAQGAVLSQGAVAAVPAAFMDDIVDQTTDWATFMTIFDPDVSGSTVKQAFAAWNTLQNDRYAYVCWDTDITPTESVPATASLGHILDQNGNSGTILIYAPDAKLASFACGAIASINFKETNGRTTLAFRRQAGIVASVTTSAAAINLGGNPQTDGSFGNGYNYYGAVGSANTNFQWFQRGSITGDFAWADSFINQIWLNNQFQLALLTLLNNAKSIPYNVAGSALIESALADPINAGLNFGAFAPGDISAAQAAQVNTDAGAKISQSLQTQGYYLQVLQASSASRASRTSPPCKFWYLDRGSVQSISLDSVAVQ